MVFHTLAGNLVAGVPRQVAIVGAKGLVQAGRRGKDGASSSSPSTTQMIRQVLHAALKESQLTIRDLDGLIAVPSLTEDHFMEAHYQATNLGLFSSKIEEDRPFRCRTIDTGGAGPVSALLEGVRMIEHEALECVAIVAADCVGSMDRESFLNKADDIFFKYQTEQHKHNNNNNNTNKNNDGDETDFILKSPAIPYGYDKVTAYQMEEFGLTRDQLRMVVCLQSFHAGLHPESLYYHQCMNDRNTQKEEEEEDSDIPLFFTSLDEVRHSPDVTPNISLLECARRADGAACLILASSRFLRRRGLYRKGIPVVIGSGESSGPLYPPEPMNETPFSCDEAMMYAYASAGNLTAEDIDFFGLYDCFPICLVRALEAAGICEKGKGGEYIEEQYHRMITAISSNDDDHNNNNKTEVDRLLADPTFFPINTHGGLLCYGAPWEVPAMYNIIEAVHQLRGEAPGRRIQANYARRCLVYGNGGIFSASSVAILARSL
jgi:acetyl-CoA acetyltransferase